MSRRKPETSELYPMAKRGALRLARSAARKKCISLKRFKEIASIESDLGPEWVAESIRDNSWVSVWYPIAEKDRDECRKNSDVLYERGRFLFGIRIHSKQRN